MFVAALVAAVGLAITFVVGGEIGCGTTDGSFELDWAGADPSRYCELSHFPGLPDTVGSALFVLGLSLAPALLLLLGVVCWLLTDRTGIFQAALVFSLIALVALLGFTATSADVDFQGPV